ncbi:MAG: GGDEF domain-containing protein [Phycisphaerales bacterium]
MRKQTVDDDRRESDAGAPGDLRVILVGRTGLDQTLRRDPRVELVRARAALDAVGELGDPIDETSPRRTVVVVGADAEPKGSELGKFLEALRIVEPGVRVARVGRAGETGAYDAALDDGAGADELRAMFNGAPTKREAPPVEVRRETPERPAPKAPEPEESDEIDVEALSRGAIVPPIVEGPGDTGVLERVLRGEDPIGAGVALIRARMGRDDVEFVPADERTRAGNPAAGCAEVRLGERLAGLLVLEGPAPTSAELEILREHAGWLSGWVRLGEQQRALRDAAFTDHLTGAWNRRYFERYLSAAIDKARAARFPVTVMVFDIDGFKRYNDEYGHAAGDEILIETVRLLRSVIRPSDRVCRIGGDEFAVIFYEPEGPRRPDSAPPSSIYAIAQRFQRQICEHRFPKLSDEAQGTLTISGGLATYPWDGADATALLNRADQLALASKGQGKNAITLGRGAAIVCKRNFDA